MSTSQAKATVEKKIPSMIDIKEMKTDVDSFHIGEPANFGMQRLSILTYTHGERYFPDKADFHKNTRRLFRTGYFKLGNGGGVPPVIVAEPAPGNQVIYRSKKEEEITDEEDSKRRKLKIELIPGDKVLDVFTEKLMGVDETFQSDEMKEILFKDADVRKKQQYSPCYHVPEEQVVKSKKDPTKEFKKYPFANFSVSFNNKTNEIDTYLIDVNAPDDLISPKNMREFNNIIRPGMEIRIVFSFSKVWYGLVNGKKGYGVGFKLHQVLYKPYVASAVSYNKKVNLFNDDNDGESKMGSDDEETKPTPKKNAAPVKPKSTSDDDEDEDDVPPPKKPTAAAKGKPIVPNSDNEDEDDVPPPPKKPVAKGKQNVSDEDVSSEEIIPKKQVTKGKSKQVDSDEDDDSPPPPKRTAGRRS